MTIGGPNGGTDASTSGSGNGSFAYGSRSLDELRSLAGSVDTARIADAQGDFARIARQMDDVVTQLVAMQSRIPSWWHGASADQAVTKFGRVINHAQTVYTMADGAGRALSTCANVVAEQQTAMGSVPEVAEPKSGLEAGDVFRGGPTLSQQAAALVEEQRYEAARGRAVEVVNGIAAQFVETTAQLQQLTYSDKVDHSFEVRTTSNNMVTPKHLERFTQGPADSELPLSPDQLAHSGLPLTPKDGISGWAAHPPIGDSNVHRGQHPPTVGNSNGTRLIKEVSASPKMEIGSQGTYLVEHPDHLDAAKPLSSSPTWPGVQLDHATDLHVISASTLDRKQTRQWNQLSSADTPSTSSLKPASDDPYGTRNERKTLHFPAGIHDAITSSPANSFAYHDDPLASDSPGRLEFASGLNTEAQLTCPGAIGPQIGTHRTRGSEHRSRRAEYLREPKETWTAALPPVPSDCIIMPNWDQRDLP